MGEKAFTWKKFIFLEQFKIITKLQATPEKTKVHLTFLLFLLTNERIHLHINALGDLLSHFLRAYSSRAGINNTWTVRGRVAASPRARRGVKKPRRHGRKYSTWSVDRFQTAARFFRTPNGVSHSASETKVNRRRVKHETMRLFRRVAMNFTVNKVASRRAKEKKRKRNGKRTAKREEKRIPVTPHRNFNDCFSSTLRLYPQL